MNLKNRRPVLFFSRKDYESFQNFFQSAIITAAIQTIHDGDFHSCIKELHTESLTKN